MAEQEEQRINGRSIPYPDRDWVTASEATEAFRVTPGALSSWEKKYPGFPERQTEGVTVRKKGDSEVPNVAWNAHELATWHAETLPGRTTEPTTTMPPFRNLGAQFSKNHSYRRLANNPPRFGGEAPAQDW